MLVLQPLFIYLFIYLLIYCFNRRMNYADAIVYLKENNITKEDGTFYEFGEVCSTYRENDHLSLVMLKMITYNHCN